MNKKEHRLLVTQKHIKEVRDRFHAGQKGVDPITGEPIPKTAVVLDHDHETQIARAALHRQSNAFEGKVLNAFKRYIAPYFDVSIDTALQNLISYWKTAPTIEAYHPGWIKKTLTEFRKLNEKQKNKVLAEFRVATKAKNSKARVEAFNKFLKTRAISFGEAMEAINYYAQLETK